MSPNTYLTSPSVAFHTLHRAHHEADDEGRERYETTIERMSQLLAARRAPLVEDWLRYMAELLPDRRRADGGIPSWWPDLAGKFLLLFVRHLADAEDVACHRFVRVITRAGSRAGYTAAELVCTQIALKRAVISRLVAENSDSPTELRLMCDRVEMEIDHIRLHIAECYYEYGERELLKAEQKHWALFNAAGDAVLLVDPSDGVVIGANQEAEALFGVGRESLLGAGYAELFEASSRQAIVDRMATTTQEGTSFLDRARLTSAEGQRISARVRTTLISYGGSRIVQSLIRDETALWRDDAEAPEDPSRLERMVAVRTRELYEAQRKYRDLYREARRQVDRMALLQEIADAALRTRTVDDLLEVVATSIRRQFRFFDISLFSVERDGVCVLRAHSGTYESLLREGYRQSGDRGLVGEAARSHRPVLANDVSKDSRYHAPSPAVRRTRSELVVPVISSERCIAVIDAQSHQLNAFDDGDVAIIQAAAGELAVGLEKVLLHEETANAHEFSHQIIQGMPSSLLAVDGENRITALNQRFARESSVVIEESLGRPLTDVVEQPLLEQSSLLEMLDEARRTGETVDRQALHHWSPEHADRFLDIRVKPLATDQHADALILINNVTESSRRIYQLDLMHRVSRLVQSALDEDYVLHAALTCVTAGPALGFNRAFVLLLDDEGATLCGRMAVGPKDDADAHRIYSKLSERPDDLDDLVAKYNGPVEPDPGSLHAQTLDCRIPILPESHCPLVEVWRDRQAGRLSREEHRGEVDCCALGHVLDSEDSAVAVIEGSHGALGLVIADNRYTRAGIQEEDIRLLATLARQTGMALTNARAHAEVARKAEQLEYAYRQLREAHDDLVRQEKLAAAGEMSARVSHEIRNPLVTIGGFARSILRDKDASEKSARNARIMVEEVEKLETFLTNWLDLARPGDSVRSPEDLNAVVEHALLMANLRSLPEGIALVKDFAADLPPVVIDARRLQQAVMNVALNGLQALNGEGTLTVRTRRDGEEVRIDLADTGVGIPEHVLNDVFKPFFTTKLSGSGLGLAVTQTIIKDHGGRVEVHSSEGEGTIITFRLPLRREGDTPNREPAKQAQVSPEEEC